MQVSTKHFGWFPTQKPRPITVEQAQLLYRWLAIPRLAVTIVSAVAVVVFWRLNALYFDPRPVLYGLVPVFVLVSLFTASFVKRGRYPVAMLYVQLGIDLLGATAAILLTGGVESAFTLLYVLIVISASVVSLRALVSLGMASALLYLALFVAEGLGVVHGPAMSPTAQAAQQTMSITVFVLIIGLIAFQSSFYLAQIRKREEEVVKLKDEFLFRTIHDLRSPSTVIRLVFEQYKEDTVGNATPEQQKNFAAVESSLKRMTGLIEDLLKTAQGDSPSFAIKQEVVDVTTVIREVAAELMPLMDKRGITFAYNPSDNVPSVVGDADKLKETFNNFVDNAIKYNRDGGTISVTHSFDANFVTTEVSDTGIGISEKSLSMLFAPYFRGDIGNEIVGTGLGLFMTRKLVQKMRGNVTVRSTKGQGTTFSVSLPRRT